MDRLAFESYSFEFLRGGKEEFALTPIIKGYYLEFGKPVEASFRYSRSLAPSITPKGSFLALYALVYGNRVKVGTSRLPYVVERMYSQAPRLATVLGVYVLVSDVKQEYVEHEIVNALGGRFKNFALSTRVEIKSVLASRRLSISAETIETIRELAELVANMSINGVKGPLFPPGEYWFTTPTPRNKSSQLLNVEPCSEKPLRKLCGKSTCKGLLTIFEDCLCLLEVKGVPDNREYTCLHTCSWIKWNMVFYDVRV